MHGISSEQAENFLVNRAFSGTEGVHPPMILKLSTIRPNEVAGTEVRALHLISRGNANTLGWNASLVLLFHQIENVRPCILGDRTKETTDSEWKHIWKKPQPWMHGLVQWTYEVSSIERQLRCWLQVKIKSTYHLARTWSNAQLQWCHGSVWIPSIISWQTIQFWSISKH